MILYPPRRDPSLAIASESREIDFKCPNLYFWKDLRQAYSSKGTECLQHNHAKSSPLCTTPDMHDNDDDHYFGGESET